MPESIDQTTMPANITDASGNLWTIVGGVVQQNGVNFGFSGGVVLLTYVGHLVWQFNGSLWWFADIPSSSWQPGPGQSASPLSSSLSGSWVAGTGTPPLTYNLEYGTVGALFTGSIAGTTLTTSAVTFGVIGTGQTLIGLGIASITEATAITGGGPTTWTVNKSQNVASGLLGTVVPSWTDVTPQVTGLTQTISGLATDTTYAVRLKTQNNVGTVFGQPAISVIGTGGGIVTPPPSSSPGIAVYNPGSAKPGVSGGSNVVTVNLTTFTNGICNKAIFGVATSGLGDPNLGHGGDDWYDWVLNPGFQAFCQDFGFRFVRVNSLVGITQAFGNSYNGVPNWSRFDNLSGGLQTCFPLAEIDMSFIANGFDISNTTLRQNFANAVLQTVQRFETRGLHLKYITAMNEPDPQNPSNVADLEARLRTAIHSVLPNILVGGPGTSFERGDFITPSAQRGAQFIEYHRYDHAAGSGISDDNIFYNPGNPQSPGAYGDNSPQNAQSDARAGALGNYMTFCTEYNLDFAASTDSRQQDYKGAVFSALLLINNTYGGLAGATIWRIENYDGTYGVSHPNTFNKNPNGNLLKACNALVGGPMVSVSMTSTGGSNSSKLACMATSDSSTGTFGMILVNYDTSLTWNGSVNLAARTSSASLTRFRTNSSTEGTTDTVTQASLSSVSMPPASVMVLGGAI